MKKLSSNTKNVAKRKDIERQLEKLELRETEEYKNYMEKWSIAELNSLIIYNYPYINDPRLSEKETTETLEKLKVMIKIASLALEDKKSLLNNSHYNKSNH